MQVSEELVRQKLIERLIELGYPKSSIVLEVGIRVGGNKRARVDLAVNRLVKNPPIFPLTHGFRDFFVLKSVMTSSFKRFAPVSRAFYSPEAVCGRFSGVLHPRWAHSTPVSA
ncbi:type I restriction enzyme HsdR N-terminal domain-containing protein [Methylomonas sp. DH-1]|uniref:type I restriction enzyme HsdR N-terminal domain-containing protein n=1 Tax=Methylomonas sp. (strain DH-1) TaxID=1727196 RepID=UPI0009EDF2E1